MAWSIQGRHGNTQACCAEHWRVMPSPGPLCSALQIGDTHGIRLDECDRARVGVRQFGLADWVCRLHLCQGKHTLVGPGVVA